MLDALIIGAGPAGCIAALMLARGGKRVLLAEQHRFPRDKVCGECLSALGYRVLERLGLSESFHELDPVKLTQNHIHLSNGTSLHLPLPEPMWGISRVRLDQWLLYHAKASGAEVLQPARCEEVHPSVIVRDLVSNQVRSLQSRWTLLADGKGALLKAKPAATGDLGLKAHFTGIRGPGNAIELFGVHGHYGGIAPIENGTWNVAFSVPKCRMQSDLDALFAQVVEENPVFRERFRSASRCTPWLVSALPRFGISHRWEPNVIALGNAAASIEPVGGEGMGLAMHSAELAANMLLSERVDLSELRRSFAILWRTRSISCRAVARLVSSPRMSRLIHPSISAIKPLRRAVMALMGK